MAKKERVLIIEDDFANAMGAMLALPKNVESKAVGDYESFKRTVDEYKPDLVLSDAEIKISKGNKDTKDYRKEISAELDKKGIPYIFVTGARTPQTHEEKVHIIKKDGDNYVTLKTFEGTMEKGKAIWAEAYEKLKKKEK